ncbi:MAG: hypothetical protein K2X27_01645, partial [Candidatus Obscuribacterales bacterium]|nr:hypothetical protein [Candidatus Obscuribacterales bacterium]
MQNTSLSGFKLGSYRIHECVGRGSFGAVYRAVADDNSFVALKIANQMPLKALDEPSLDESLTEAFCIYSGGYGDVSPSPAALLELQVARSQASSGLLPKCSGPFVFGNTHYLLMDFVKGMTLRRLLAQGLKAGEQKIRDLDLAIKVFEAFEALLNSGLKYHGDLKPENIILAGAGVRLVDPGYFGPLACLEGMIPQVVITTPRYYPTLEAD